MSTKQDEFLDQRYLAIQALACALVDAYENTNREIPADAESALYNAALYFGQFTDTVVSFHEFNDESGDCVWIRKISDPKTLGWLDSHRSQVR